jgi:hypothetical protein
MRISNVSVKADESPTEPATTVTDYHNGTICTIVDYGNGTQDFTIETTADKSATLYESNNQSIPLVLENHQGQANGTRRLAVNSESTLASVTHTEVINQQILMRWEYTFFKGRWDMTLGNFLAYVRIGVVVDIEFGIRLPVNITIEYESPVIFDQSNTTMYATITPIDLPNFNESLFIFKSYFFVECGGWLIPRGPYTWICGPNYDLSQSFVTPLGDAIAFPIPPIPALSIAEFETPLLGSLLEIDLGVQPGFGSKKITAKMTATGDAQAVQGVNILWSYPDQSVPFIVRFGDYDPSVDWALIKLSDFRYYFTQFYVRFWLMFDFGSWIDWLLHDFSIPLITIDMSWLIKNRDWCVGSPQSIDLWFRQPVAVHDIAVTDVAPSIYKCYPGDVIDIAVVVENKGTSTEAFNVSLYYDNHLITRTQMSQVLENKTSRILQLEWNTTDVLPGNYTIKAEVSSVPDEVDVTNNEKTDGIVTVALYQLLAVVVDGSVDPIPNAIVEIIGQQASTDANGEARFSLAKGSYHVKASKGTLNNSINVDLAGDTIVRIALVPPPYGPKAEFTAIPEMARANELVTFDASSSQPGYDGTHTMVISEYRWDFCDGNITTTFTPIVTHAYATPARYNVTLTVLDSVGLTDSVTRSVKITHLADLNLDGKVDLKDYFIAAKAFGEDPTRPRWNPLADINRDGKVDLKDVYIVAKGFGWVDP